MSATNLLSLNVNTLFEQHSVPEIDIVHKKIQAVVEKKREELRTMVGERYRDLLQAADTIAEMQESSSTLIDQVDAITAECRTLNEEQLIGFKTNDAVGALRNRNANKQLQNYFSTMVQIKLLTALPELIWSHIDHERYYAATELFIFSRHISTGLQLDVQNALMQHLPVAKKQWEILKPFHVTIKQHLIEVLEREELGADMAADCLLSLLLLEKSNLNAVLKTFLQLRCAAFAACLTGTGEGTDGAQRRVKERILASLKVLNGTIELMGACFLPDGPLFSKLAEYTDLNAPPTIALMDSNDAQFAYMLPEIISNFRPKFETDKLDNMQVHTALEHWLNDTKNIASVHLKELFQLVPSMSMIQELKHEAHSYKKHLNFAPLAERFQLQQSLDFYELQYVSLINQRVRDIIRDNWAQAMQHTYKQLEEALPSAAVREQQMWVEQNNELPLSLAEALSDDSKCKKLLMKTKGYDNDIIELCTEFDRHLAGIVDDLNVLLEEQATRAEEKLSLVEFLRETANTELMQFLGQVQALSLQQSSAEQQRKQLLFLVRVCVALVELCPHLRICFCQQSSWRQWIGNAAGNSFEYWQRLCQRYEQETYSIWLQIVDGILEEQHCNGHLPAAVAHDVALQDFANWDTITLDQKDDVDNIIHSNFHIPNQPRICLQSYLFTLIRFLNAVVPQTLPAKVLHAFNQKLLTQLLGHYTELSRQPNTSSNQHVALQLYFDIKFLQNTFAINRDERALFEQFQTVQHTFKEFIDPFDFELFAEHIANNIKRATARLHCQLGVLTPVTSLGSAATPALAQDKEPNVLSLSASGSTSLWFPLLPIVTANTSGADSKKAISTETEKVTPTRKATSSTAAGTSTQRKTDNTITRTKSGAASFFGAMSQEWFR